MPGGGRISLANMRRALRAALPDDLSWVTPHSFRRTGATVVRDAHGPAAAQQQLSHAKLATTDAHYSSARPPALTCVNAPSILRWQK
jgi:integrase